MKEPKQRLAARVRNLKPSPVFELLQKAKDLKKQGRDIINLSVGEPVWDTYDKIKKAGKQAIEEGYTKYTSSAGIPELRKAISKRVSQDFGFSVSPDCIVAAAGCKQGLFTVFQCLCNPKDEVIVPAPYWLSYSQIINLSGAHTRTVFCDESTGFKITSEKLRQAITEKTKAFLLNSPNNPTSAIYTAKELKALAEVLKANPHVFIVTDDIYDRIVFEGTLAPQLLQVCPELKERTFCVNGASKNYLMTGWRLAWIISPKDYTHTLSSFQSQSISCVSSIAQKALAESLLSCDGDIKNLKENLKSLRDELCFLTQKTFRNRTLPFRGRFLPLGQCEGHNRPKPQG